MGVTHPSIVLLSGKERGMHPSYRSENVWFSKQSFDQFRAPQSYLLFEFLGVSLWVPPFSIMQPSYYGQKRFTLKILYRFVIKIL